MVFGAGKFFSVIFEFTYQNECFFRKDTMVWGLVVFMIFEGYGLIQEQHVPDLDSRPSIYPSHL